MADCPINGKLWVERLRRCETWLVISHVRPDADTLGSAVAVARFIERLGATTRLIGDFSVPTRLRFLDPQSRFERFGESVTAEEILSLGENNDTENDRDGETTGLLAIDLSSWSQMGGIGDVFRDFCGPRMIVDHHIASAEFDSSVDVFRDDTAAATGEIVQQLIETADDAAGKVLLETTPVNGITPMLDSELATPLFAALATDTGWFRFRSATSTTFHAAARLIEAGAEPAAIYRSIYEQESPARMSLFGRFMDHLRLTDDGWIASSWLSSADFDETGAMRSDCEDMVNELLRIDGVQVAVFFTEQKPAGDGVPGAPSGAEPNITPEIRLSLRSRSDFNCAKFALETFGGGGHAAAAGATSCHSLRETITDTLSALQRWISPPQAVPAKVGRGGSKTGTGA